MASNAPPSVDTSGAFAAAPEDDAEPRLAQLQRLAGVDVASGVSSSCGGVVVTADAAWFRASNAQSLCVAAEVAGRTRAALLARLHVPGRGAAAGALNAATQRVLAAAPARLHLCCGGNAAWGMPGAALAVAAPCVESALAAMCCAALAGGDSGCVAAAAPALGAALRDALLGVSLQTGRSALCGGGGAPHVRVRDLHAAALLALSPAAGAPLAPRALWAEALSHCLLSVPWGGPAALLRLCRAMVTHGDVAAALEDAAHGALRPRGFAAALQAWARSTLRAEAAAYQTGWLGGAGALSPAAAAYLAADPDAAVSWLDYSPPASRNGVRPATLRANLAWLATLMATEKPRDLAWCLAAVGFNAAWAIFAPLIISDIITIAPAIAAAAADGAPLEPLRLLHGGMMPDYTVYAGRNAANALAILAGAFGGGAAVSAHMNRQLSARSVGNPGFGLGARAALARRLAAAPGLLADTAGLAAAARAAQHDAHLVGAATSATFTAANALGQLALALALMFLINARMAGFFLATLPVTALLTGLQGRASGQLSATLKTRQEALEVAADAALLCAGAAAGSGTHDTAVAAAGAAAEAAADEISVAAAVLQQYVAIVSGGLMAFLLGLGGQQMAAGRLDVGLFVAFISAAGAAAPQVPALVEAVRAWRVAGRAAALLRGADAVRAPPAPALDGADSDKAPALLAAAPALAARGVAFAYARSPSRALVAASFDLPGGAKCVLVGRSGAGKTTLLRLLAGRYLPAQGALLADGAPLAAAARAAGPGGVAFAPAEPMLFAGSVADNIAMGLPSAVIASLPDGGQARVAAAAKAAGLIGDGASVSLATRVGGAGALSSGQRQRIGIARALASQAPLLLLDEPTSNADGATAAALVAALVALGDGCTVVAATNAPALFESGGFSHGMCIAGATVAEAGPLDALVAARGAYARTAAAVGVACDASAPLAPAALRAALWPLAAASDAECALLAPLLAPRTLPAGTTLFAAGTAPAAAFVLARGRVELRSAPGSAPAVAVPVGACFQEGSLLDAAAVASRTAVATAADTVVLELRCAALAALAPLAPRLAASITALAAARDAAVTPAALRAAAWPLQRLDDEALTALAAASSIEVLQPGDALCVRGGACPGLAVVLAGQAAVTRRLLTGGETVTTITAGGAFGADSLVTAGQGGAEVEVQAAGAAPTVLLLLPHAALLPPALPPPACADDAAFARAAAELGAAAAAWRAAAGADALAAHWLLHAALPDAVQRASATSALAASALPLPLGAPAHLPSPRALGALIPVADVDIADDEASGTANAACPGDGAWAAVGELAPGAAATSPALLRAGPAALAALLSRDAFANAVGAEGLARAAAAAGALAAASSALRAAGVASGRAVALRRGEAAFAPHSADDAAVLLHGRLAPPYDDVATGTLLLRSQAAQAAMPTQLAAALGGGRVAEGTCGGDVGSVLLPAALGSRPAASGAPVLSGVASLGGALTVQLPALSPGAEPASPVFAWLADGAPIARACKATYAPEPADVGRALAVRCRAAPWHDESVLAAVPAKVPLGDADATAARDAALAAVAARGCAAFACSVSAARGGAAASLEGEACVLELSAAGARLARPGAAAEQRSRLATLLFGDGSVTVASAAWGAPGLALCGARGDGDAPCGAYLQVHADCHVMLKFASPRERNGALAAARALAARRRKPLPAL